MSSKNDGGAADHSVSTAEDALEAIAARDAE